MLRTFIRKPGHILPYIQFGKASFPTKGFKIKKKHILPTKSTKKKWKDVFGSPPHTFSGCPFDNWGGILFNTNTLQKRNAEAILFVGKIIDKDQTSGELQVPPDGMDWLQWRRKFMKSCLLRFAWDAWNVSNIFSHKSWFNGDESQGTIREQSSTNPSFVAYMIFVFLFQKVCLASRFHNWPSTMDGKY